MNYNTGETIDETFTYNADGNMTSAYHDGSRDTFKYDSTNRLIGTNTNAYTYNAENVRIRNLCGDSETTYVYNTNAKLSSMLMKRTDGVVTDSNGLIYMRARYYSPELRRFIKETLYRYTPDEKQWWISGFDPSTQGRTADDLEASLAIDFSDNTEMMDELKAKYGDDWKFYGNIGVFTF